MSTTTWNRQDVLGTLRAVGPWWSQLVAGRPGAADVVAPHLGELAGVLGCEPTLEAVAHAAAAAGGAGGDRWEHDLVPLAEAHLAAVAAAGAALRAARTGEACTGRVVQVSASGGGVPKRPLDVGEVGWRGLGGDRQGVRLHHGRVWQALCLWSVEVIATLAAEGHPVSCGSTGENLTLASLPWEQVRAGSRLRIGGDVVAEVSVFATPCKTIAGSFTGRDFRRIDHDDHPGSSRVYASVVQPGVVRPGDVVVLDPA